MTHRHSQRGAARRSRRTGRRGLLVTLALAGVLATVAVAQQAASQLDCLLALLDRQSGQLHRARVLVRIVPLDGPHLLDAPG